MTTPVQQAVTDEMILAAQNYDLAHRGESIVALWTAVPDRQVARLLAGASPLIRASAELAAGKAVMQREERIQQLEKMAGDMLSRFRDPYGFPVPFCPSLAQYDRWRDVLYGGEQK